MSSLGRDSTVQSRETLIVGGGIAGIEALMALADLGESRLRLRLVSGLRVPVLLFVGSDAPWPPHDPPPGARADRRSAAPVACGERFTASRKAMKRASGA